MNGNDTTTRTQLAVYLRRALDAGVIVVVLLVLAGCITSYAAGPSDKGAEVVLAEETSLPTATPTASPVPTTGGITTVPKAFRVLQATSPVEVTVTPTPGEVADTPTPTATPLPTATPSPTATATPLPTNTAQPAAEATPEPFKAYAWVDNYYPAPGSVVTVHGALYRYGRPVCGANMGATWRYTCGTDYCSAYTDIRGKAECARQVGCALPNYWVYIDVVFTYEDQQYFAKTGFVVDP
jgi:hypothetical protein